MRNRTRMMGVRLLLLAVALMLPIHALAALSATCVFEVRTTGNANNGGAFNSAAAGTDYSQSDTPQVTVDGATITAVVHTTTTQLNVTGYTVAAGDVGNVYQVSGGTGTAGFYEITASDVPNNRWTVDRSVGTAAQTTTGRMGGALTTPGKACGAMVAGNDLYIKAGAYSITSATTNIVSGCMAPTGGASSANACRIVGYQTTRGDLGTKPLLQASGISTFTLLTPATNTHVENLELDGASLTSSRGVTCANLSIRIRSCKFDNFTNNGVSAGANTLLTYCEATGCSTSAALTGGLNYACNSHGNTNAGFSTASTGGFIRCLSYGNTGATSDGFLFSGTTVAAIGCTAYGNGRDGFRSTAASVAVALTNCVATGNTGWGFNASATHDNSLVTNCAHYGNTSGGVNTTLPYVTGTIACAADPFVNAAGANFALNNAVLGGNMLKAAGWPTSWPGASTATYSDVGATQRRVPTRGSGG